MARKGTNRPAFSLLELLVVVAILAVVLSLVTVSVQKARATASRVGCFNHLHNIGQAAIHYHFANNRFPTEFGNNPSFYKTILPYVQGGNADDLTPVPIFLCPGRRSVADVGGKRDFGYVASAALDPASFSILDAPSGVSLTGISRGATNTFLLTTLWMDPKNYINGDPTDLGWVAKQNSRPFGAPARPDNDPSGNIRCLGGPFSSDLPVLFADGHVEWVAYLGYADRWSLSSADGGNKPPVPLPTGRTVVVITVPNNAFQVEFEPGTEPGDFDEHPGAEK